MRGLPSLVKDTADSSAFSKGLLGNKGFKADDRLGSPPPTAVVAADDEVTVDFLTGVMVAVGVILNFIFLALLGSAGVNVTDGAITVGFELEIFCNDMVGILDTTWTLGFPVAGVKVQDPMVLIPSDVENDQSAGLLTMGNFL